jgi:hypothetical protein
MTTKAKTLTILSGAIVAVGAVTAIVLGGTRARVEATLPAGTELVAALEQEVSTARSDVGDAIVLQTIEPIRVGPHEEIPAGVLIHGTVTEAKGGGSIAGAPDLELRFTDLEVDGNRQPISAQAFHVTGHNEAGKSALEIGGGAAAGAVVGRVFGGKKGTVPGAVVGAAIGTGVALQSEGGELVLPKGQRLRVRLSAPVTVSYRRQEPNTEG